MKKIIYLLLFVLIFTTGINAQVTIGSQEAPTQGAALELKSDTLGFLPTRVKLVSLSLPDPLPAHEEGMVVYNTTVNSTANLQAGLYYNTGNSWVLLSSANEPWYVIGGASQATANTQNIYQSGKVGVGSSYGSGTITSTLEVDGASTNKTSFNAGTGANVAVDFTQSNLARSASTSATPTFNCNGVKDGGAYTLAWQQGAAGSANINVAGMTAKIFNNQAKTATQDAVYTIVCINTTAYIYVTIF